MWITNDVDLPQELIDAHAAGTLVLFVGAGASYDTPSNLPLFDELTRRIAALANRTWDERIRPDVFLSELEQSDHVDVHSLAAQVLEAHESTPNDNHLALVKLAVAGGSGGFRIVTTNYDQHINEVVAREIKTDLDWHSAPALPLGRDFTGIVSLHGSLDRPHKDMILTDVDFGRAYFTDAWATHFLEQMFAEYTVLFVGYSHEDTVMTYLAKGLIRPSARFALTSDPFSNRWHQLGITPVEYPAVGGDHSASTRALVEWERSASMGALDHRTRIQGILGASPPNTPADRDYLRSIVSSPLGARFFGEFADGEEWLEWAEGHPKFLANFSPAVADEAGRSFAEWFARRFVAVAEMQAHAISVVQRHGTDFSDNLLYFVTLTVSEMSESRPSDFRAWIAILAPILARTRGRNAWLVERLLSQSKWPRDRDAIITLVEIALTPELRLSPALRYSLEDSDEVWVPRSEIVWPLDVHALDASWRDKIPPFAMSTDHVATQLTEDALVRAYASLRGYQGEAFFDAPSFGRAGIETHPQNRRRGVEDLLVDVLRDWSVDANPLSLVERALERWWKSEIAIFRRLVVNARRARPEWDADTKVRWVIKNALLFDSHCKHEVFGLLAESIGALSMAARADLLRVVLEGPADPRYEGHEDYMIFNLVSWLVSSAPDWSQASESLEELRLQNPRFAPRVYPDLNHYVESGVASGLNESTESFVERVRDSASDAVRWLTSVKSLVVV
jgi:hypothetical protein